MEYLMNKNFNTILYSSDLNRGSRDVFKLAVKQAIQNQSTIFFLHVFEPFIRDDGERSSQFRVKNAHKKHLDSVTKDMKALLNKRIYDFMLEELDGDEIAIEAIEVLVEFGEASQTIIEMSKQHNIDLIVMGDRRVNALSRMFLGSTAQKVIHRSKVPVLIVPISNQLKNKKESSSNGTY